MNRLERWKEVAEETIKKDIYKNYEDVLPQLFKQMEFNYELVDGLKWIEIDFPRDIMKARSLD